MKKIAIATLLALSVGSAHALELGVTTSHAPKMDKNGMGLSLGLVKVGPLHTTAAWEKFEGQQDRYSVVAALPLTKVEKLHLSLKAGGVWLHNQHQVNGYAAVAGVGLDLPLSKKMTVGVDATRQWGETKVSNFDGNKVTASLKFKF